MFGSDGSLLLLFLVPIPLDRLVKTTQDLMALGVIKPTRESSTTIITNLSYLKAGLQNKLTKTITNGNVSISKTPL